MGSLLLATRPFGRPAATHAVTTGDQLAAVEVSPSLPALANEPGAWTDVFAASDVAGDVGWIGLRWTKASTASNTFTGALLDLGIGTSGQEQVLIPSILVSGWSNSGSDNNAVLGRRPSIWFPIFIPKGVRIAARITRAELTAQDPGFTAYLLPLPPVDRWPTRCATEGVTLPPTTTADYGASFNGGASNVWVEMIAATSVPALYFGASIAQGDSSAPSSGPHESQFGYGTAGLERVIGHGAYAVDNMTSSETYTVLHRPPVPVDWPAGVKVFGRSTLGSAHDLRAAIHLFY